MNDTGDVDEATRDVSTPDFERPGASHGNHDGLRIEQKYGAVSIVYDAQHYSTPLADYARLLNDISAVPTIQNAQFSSSVGLGAVALLAGALGFIMGSHVLLLVWTFQFPTVLTNWSLYAIALCVYHWSEFLITAFHHPQSVSFDSFLVNQSKEFGIAITFSWLEFWLESWLAPSLKHNTFIAVAGLIIVVLGQVLRSLSMYQAGPSFTHMVAFTKAPRHRLVTDGVYSYLRHPGYFGWFYWSIGTQLLLGNPICAVAYFMVAQTFFRNRIPMEETGLIEIFGDIYKDYMKRTIIGIPGVKSAVLST